MIIESFFVILLVFVLIGVSSVIKSRRTSEDYLLASSQVKPWLVALSAVATNNSGYMFIGMIGYTYLFGLSSIWLLAGMIVGDYLVSLIVHKNLRDTTGKQKVVSFAGILSRWHGNDYRVLRALGGLITIVFLGIYAAAQFKAGSKALHVLFDWHYSTGSLIGAVVVLLYCIAGGIRASIWTDAAQSFVMIAAMAVVFIAAVLSLGGMHHFATALNQVSPTYMNWFTAQEFGHSLWGPVLFVAGWVFAGMGVVGQPHIMVRFMAMDNANSMRRARYYYYGWFILFSALTVCAGLAARIILANTHGFDPELALPTLAGKLLPDALVGLILAGLFAATMSTADSQILSCSAAITHDFVQEENQSPWTAKFATVLVTIIALYIALWGADSVFNLVMIAWSALACAFGPLLITYALGGKPTQLLAILMMLVGLGVMLLWRHWGLSDTIFEAAPGMVAGLLCYPLGRCFKK